MLLIRMSMFSQAFLSFHTYRSLSTHISSGSHLALCCMLLFLVLLSPSSRRSIQNLNKVCAVINNCCVRLPELSEEVVSKTNSINETQMMFTLFKRFV